MSNRSVLPSASSTMRATSPALRTPVSPAIQSPVSCSSTVSPCCSRRHPGGRELEGSIYKSKPWWQLTSNVKSTPAVLTSSSSNTTLKVLFRLLCVWPIRCIIFSAAAREGFLTCFMAILSRIRSVALIQVNQGLDRSLVVWCQCEERQRDPIGRSATSDCWIYPNPVVRSIRLSRVPTCVPISSPRTAAVKHARRAPPKTGATLRQEGIRSKQELS